MTRRLDYVIAGAGAIGSVMAAHLIRGGHSVAVTARGKRAAQIEAEGLRIKGLLEFQVPCALVRDAAEIDTRVLVVAIKTPGSDATLADLSRGRAQIVFSIQNGLEKNELLQRHFGAEAVLGGLANTSAEILPTGEVLFTRNVNILIGELDGRLSERAEAVAKEINASGVRSAARANILGLEWSKFAAWAGMMALSVTTRSVSWKFMTDEHGALVLARLIREIGTLAQAQGVTLTDDSVLPVASLCRLSEAEATQVVINAGRELAASAPAHRMSSLQDLDSGRPLEIEATLGYARRKAATLGVATPLLDVCYHLVSAIDVVGRSDK